MESNHNKNGNHHHILPTKTALMIGGALLVLTVVTVAVAHVDLGRFNFFVAMLVASVKALLVTLFFMNLYYDSVENSVIFGTSFIFLAIFIILASTDLFFRGDVYVKGPLTAVQTKSKYKNPWIATPELIAHGKQLYTAQCTSCHGDGKGDGVAAAALTPKPRNFLEAQGWKNGRKPTMVFKTLKEGLPPSAMASYATLPSDDRWALAHYVLSMGPKPDSDTPADFAKIGVDPSQAGGGEKELPTIPIELAMERVAQADSNVLYARAHLPHTGFQQVMAEPGTAAHLYQTSCAQCHGNQGQGGIKVKNLGVNPVSYVVTERFKAQTAGLQSSDAFGKVVTRGLQGNLMPGMGHLSSSELQGLFQYVKGLASSVKN